ncbi:MAG: hypothetical protein Q8Q09_14260 [Deltaproteobacteria bacterium]|nr:hypothetical protein [Deltaproteobacteria bacterium]
MKIKFALGLVVSIFGCYGGCGGPVLPPYCVTFRFEEAGNRMPVTNAYMDLVSGPDAPLTRVVSYDTDRVIVGYLCRGTSELEFGHADFLPKRLTYTSPRDRDRRTNDFTDSVVVTLTRR